MKDEATVPVDEAARLLGVAEETLRRAAKRGVIQADRTAHGVFVSLTEARVFVENQEMFTDDLAPEWQAASDAIAAQYRQAYIILR